MPIDRTLTAGQRNAAAVQAQKAAPRGVSPLGSPLGSALAALQGAMPQPARQTIAEQGQREIGMIDLLRGELQPEARDQTRQELTDLLMASPFMGVGVGSMKNMPKVTFRGVETGNIDLQTLSRAERLPNHPFLVFDVRKQKGIEGVFPTEEAAKKFISSSDKRNFLDFGSPREIEQFNPTGPESLDFQMQEIRNLLREAGAANKR